MKDKDKLYKSLIAFAIILPILVGVSYAYYLASVSGNYTNATGTVQSNIDITLNTANDGYITATNMIPIPVENVATDAEIGTFSVVSGNNFNKIKYTLSLTNITLSSNLNTSDLKWELYNTDTSTSISNGNFSGAPSSITMKSDILIDANTTTNYQIRIYILETGADQTSLMNGTFSAKVSITSSLEYNPSSTYQVPLDNSGANAPLLATNMIPVYYDNTNDVWKKADSTNSNATYKWYDYNAQMWANAVTVTSSTRSTYNSAAVGTQIPMSDIMGMWVWIPRYEYMTTNLGTSYAGGTQALPGGITIKFISGTSTTSDTNYLIHPAFRNGTVYKYSADYDLGGWDKELTGFWMGKFETGYATNFTTTTGAISSSILVKPDVYSMRYQVVSNQYTTAASIQSDHGIGSTVETHMLKNDEWGAVAYLSQSAYGKYGNSDYTGANKEIYVNNAFYSTGPIYTTGRSNGVYSGGTGSGSTQYGTYEYNNCPASAYTHIACTESARNTNNTKGTGASTTGNIYGVYDMSGGAYEYLMANLSGTVSSSGFLSMPSQKYWNKYTSTTLVSACNGSPCYGQAITETGTGSDSGQYQWYNDWMYFVTSTYPWAYRGGDAGSAGSAYAGAFGFYSNAGGAYSYIGFRASIS